MKRIILCSDGTWNKPDQKDRKKTKPSNVLKMARAVKPTDSKGITQVVFYDKGVGTNKGIDKYLGGLFGSGLEENIKDCYRFLIHNYSVGDEIFLFGFSRGAYTVRSLAGLIKKCGILSKVDAFFIQKAYDTYKLKDTKENMEKVARFRLGKDTQSRNEPTFEVDIKFIGVWDTVGSLGIPATPLKYLSRSKHQFHDTSLGLHIKNAYQALAIDERRKPFEPTLWNAKKVDGQKMEQKWFAGVHTNIGGGYKKDGLANCAFQWIKE